MPRMQHVVLLKFPRELTPDEEAWMFRVVGAWPKEIPGFKPKAKDEKPEAKEMKATAQGR